MLSSILVVLMVASVGLKGPKFSYEKIIQGGLRALVVCRFRRRACGTLPGLADSAPFLKSSCRLLPPEVALGFHLCQERTFINVQAELATLPATGRDDWRRRSCFSSARHFFLTFSFRLDVIFFSWVAE